MEPGKTALKQKFDELVGLLGYIVDLTGDGREVPEWLKEQISEIREMLATITPAEQDTAPAIVKTGDLWLLGLSSRPRGSLERYGVMTIDQAREKRDAELLKLKGLGYKSLKEIRKKIAIYDALSKNPGIKIMSNYFDDLDKQVHQINFQFEGDVYDVNAFVEEVARLEDKVIEVISLVVGDREFPDDLRQRILGIIAIHRLRGIPDVDKGGFHAVARGFTEQLRRSALFSQLHSAFHDVARRRIRTRFGLLLDD